MDSGSLTRVYPEVSFQYKHLLGYRKGDDGKPEIVPEEAETVRMIYDLFLDGYSMTDIALTLLGRMKMEQLNGMKI